MKSRLLCFGVVYLVIAMFVGILEGFELAFYSYIVLSNVWIVGSLLYKD